MDEAGWRDLARRHIAELKAALRDHGQPPGAHMSILCPAYFHPTDPGWQALQDAAGRVRTIAVANPSSGPGNAPQAAYTATLDAFGKAGGIPLGYVATTYGAKEHAAVAAEIDRWASFYPAIRGIFFDEQASDVGLLRYYHDAFAAARSRISSAVVVSNPGDASLAEAFLSDDGGADVYVIHEGNATVALAAPAYAGRYPPARFGALQFAASREQMLAFVADAKAKGIGNVYVTGDVLANPWDTVATYFADEVAAVAAA